MRSNKFWTLKYDAQPNRLKLFPKKFLYNTTVSINRVEPWPLICFGRLRDSCISGTLFEVRAKSFENTCYEMFLLLEDTMKVLKKSRISSYGRSSVTRAGIYGHKSFLHLSANKSEAALLSRFLSSKAKSQ